jgi:hypothetical protein
MAAGSRGYRLHNVFAQEGDFVTAAQDAPAGPDSERSSGRRHAVFSLAGLGAVSMALMGRGQARSAGVASGSDGPAGPALLSVGAAKKKKKGKRGPTGPTGPAATLIRDSEDVAIRDGGTESGQANCPSGEATGGGAGISNTNCAVVTSGPVGTDAWSATGKCPSGQSATMTVMVICLG